RQHRPHHRHRVRARRRLRRRRRSRLRPEVRSDRLPHGLHPRSQGLHRSRPRGHRQHLRSHARRPGPRRRRSPVHRLHLRHPRHAAVRQPVLGRRLGLRTPHPRAPLQAAGSARRARRGQGVTPMTTQTTTAQTPDSPAVDTPRGLIGLPEHLARALATGGGVLTVLSTFLAWTWTSAFPGDLTVYGYPGGLQVLVLIGGALTALFGLASYGVKGLQWLTPAGADSAIKLSSLAALVTTWYTVLAISATLGGLVHLEPGAWVAAVASLLAVLGALSLPFERPEPDPHDPDDTGWEKFRHDARDGFAVVRASIATGRTRAPRPLPSYAEILIIVATLAMGLVVFTYGIATEYDELFIGFLITAGFGFAALLKAGLINRVSAITAKHRNVTMIGAFVAAAAFPFTQSDDQYATIGVYILIFATVALGLNIVVGL